MDHILLAAGLLLSAPQIRPIPAAPAAGRPVAAANTPSVVVASQGAAVIDWAAFRAALGAADVVLAGEQHDLAAHHLAQLDVLREFHARRVLASVGDIDRTRASDIWKMSEADFSPSGEEAAESDSPSTVHATLPRITHPLGPTPASGSAFSGMIATPPSAPAARPRRADLRRALPGLHQGVAFGTRPRRSGAS